MSNNKNTPPVGSYAILNGKRVRWGGNSYGWQSPASFKKLEASGEFKVGGAQLNQLGRAFAPALQAVQGFQQRVKKATPWLDPVERTVNRAATADDRLPSSRVAAGGAIVAQRTANALNIDPRLGIAAGLLVGGVRNADNADDAARAARAAKRPPAGDKWHATPEDYTRLRGIQDGSIKPTNQDIGQAGKILRGNSQGHRIIDRQIAGAVADTQKGMHRLNEMSMEEAKRLARAFQAKRINGKPSNATPRNVRLQGGEVVKVKPDADVQILRAGMPSTRVPAPRVVPGSGDPLSRARTTGDDSWRPRTQTLGKAGQVRNIPNQISSNGSPTTARVSAGGYKPSGGGKAPFVDAKGNVIDNPATRQTYGRSTGYTDLHGQYDSVSTTKGGELVVIGIDPTGRPITTRLGEKQRDVPIIDGKDRYGTSEGRVSTAPANRPFAEPRRDVQANRPSTPNKGRDGATLRRLRAEEAARDRNRTGNVAVSPSYADSSDRFTTPRPNGNGRIIYENGSLNVERKNPFDPNPANARYKGYDVSNPRNVSRDSLYEGDAVTDADGFPDWSRENGYNPGFREGKRKGVRGDSGSAARSVSDEIRQQLIHEYRNSTADKSAVPSTQRPKKGQPREILIPGTGNPSDDWLNPRLNKAIAEHRAKGDLAIGKRTPDAASPGNRYAGRADRDLSEAVKKGREPRIRTYGGSMPAARVDPTSNRAAIPGIPGVHRQARGGRVKRMYGRPVRRWNNNLGETYNLEGDSFARQQRAAMSGRAKSDPIRIAAQNARDPQLDRITRRRNQSVRARNNHSGKYQGFMPINFESLELWDPKVAAKMRKKHPGGTYAPRKGFGGKDEARHAQVRQRTGKHNTAVDGRYSRPIQVVPEAPEPKQRKRKGIDPYADPGTSGRTYSEAGYDALRHNGRVEFLERSDEIPLNKTSQHPIVDRRTGKIVGRRAPAARNERRLNNVPVELDTQRGQRYTDEMRRIRAEQRRAGLTGKRVTGGRITEAEAKKALEQLQRSQRRRTGGLDQSGAGQIRAHNERIRAERLNSRLPEFSGAKLPSEVVDPHNLPMPNITPPPKSDARFDSTSYGDYTAEQFKSNGELKGVTQRGKTKNKGRSSGQTKSATTLLNKVERRKESGKSPSIRQRYKRNGTRPDGTTYTKGELKEMKPGDKKRDDEMRALRARRANRR